VIKPAFIGSTALTPMISSCGLCDMALTQYVEDNEAYREYFAERSKHGLVILDNGAFELHRVQREGEPFARVLEAARLIQASVVILSDVPYDQAATLDASRKAATLAEEWIARGTLHPNTEYMFVPQADSIPGWLDSVEEGLRLAEDFPRLRWLGISKLSTPKSFNSPVHKARPAALRELLTHHKDALVDKKLHLLGGNFALLFELTQYVSPAYCLDSGQTLANALPIQSIDSSAPFWLGWQGKLLRQVTPEAGHAWSYKEESVQEDVCSQVWEREGLDYLLQPLAQRVSTRVQTRLHAIWENIGDVFSVVHREAGFSSF